MQENHQARREPHASPTCHFRKPAELIDETTVVRCCRREDGVVVVKSLFRDNGDEHSRQACEQTGKPEPIHPLRGDGHESDAGTQWGGRNGVDRSIAGDGTLNED